LIIIRSEKSEFNVQQHPKVEAPPRISSPPKVKIFNIHYYWGEIEKKYRDLQNIVVRNIGSYFFSACDEIYIVIEPFACMIPKH